MRLFFAILLGSVLVASNVANAAMLQCCGRDKAAPVAEEMSKMPCHDMAKNTQPDQDPGASGCDDGCDCKGMTQLHASLPSLPQNCTALDIPVIRVLGRLSSPTFVIYDPPRIFS